MTANLPLTMTVLVLHTAVMNATQNFTLDQLCTLVDLPRRTVRYYIQLGLVDRPGGSNRGAFYTERHGEQLLAVKKWREAGVSLERIAEILSGASEALTALRAPRPGEIAVWSRVTLANGLELHLEPGRAGLTPEQARELARIVLEGYQNLVNTKENNP